MPFFPPSLSRSSLAMIMMAFSMILAFAVDHVASSSIFSNSATTASASDVPQHLHRRRRQEWPHVTHMPNGEVILGTAATPILHPDDLKPYAATTTAHERRRA